jgi:hypothetical protein
MEVWWIGSNGSIQAGYWYGTTWARYSLATAGSASVTGGIAAISREEAAMETWWVGNDGSIQAGYWYDGYTQWAHYPLAGPGQASTTSGIAALACTSKNMDVWWVGGDGSIQSGTWYDNGTKLYNDAGSARACSGLAAVSQIQNHEAYLWVGGNGSIQFQSNMTDEYILLLEALRMGDPAGHLVFNSNIVTNGATGLGGSVTVTIQPDGTIRWQGHTHCGAPVSKEFGIGAVIRTSTNRVIALAHSGQVGGTVTSGSRDHEWDITKRDSVVAEHFKESLTLSLI